MYTEILSGMSGLKLNMWKNFMTKSNLLADNIPQKTVLVWEGEEIIASGSRDGSILKYIAVDSARQGENLAGVVVSLLKKDAFMEGIDRLFLYTKPGNERLFTPLFFYKVVTTSDVLLMESQKDGLKNYLDLLPSKKEGVSGAVVANCNPFTLGHKYLLEEASQRCDTLYVFAVSEDKSLFSASDRLEMIKLGTEHIQNAVILSTGPYLISSATFPTYFLKGNADEIKCLLDVEMFANVIAPRLGITKRFVGTEPDCGVTCKYNEILKSTLPQYGIELCEIERLKFNQTPVSASLVRKYMEEKKIEEIKSLVPETSRNFIMKML